MNLDSFLHVVIISSICMMRQFVFSIRTDVLSSSEMTIVTTFNAWSRLSSILFHGRMSFWSFSSIPCVRTLSAVVENVYNVTHVVCVFLFTCQRRPDPFFPRLSKNCEERFFCLFFSSVEFGTNWRIWRVRCRWSSVPVTSDYLRSRIGRSLLVMDQFDSGQESQGVPSSHLTHEFCAWK